VVPLRGERDSDRAHEGCKRLLGSGDPQSGYTAISLHALESTDIEEMYEYYGYCNDLLVKLNVADARVADVPRPITYGDEESDISYRSYIPRVSAMLFRNFLRRIWTKYVLFDFHPLVVAYAAGAVATVAGALGVGRTVREVATDGDSAESGTTSLSLLLGAVPASLPEWSWTRAPTNTSTRRTTGWPDGSRPTERRTDPHVRRRAATARSLELLGR